MGKGRNRAVEKRVAGQGSSVISSVSSNIPLGPVYYPTEEEFKDPLEFICKIRPEAETYGICKIIPPKSWKPPFALDLDSFTFPTKTQSIHQLQVRSAACDSKTFELEYNRFLEEHCGKKAKKKVIFEGEELDLCRLFNAVKRYGGYDKAAKGKKWGEVFRFVRSAGKISECAKHVLCQLYREHLYDYENYYNQLNQEKYKSCNRGMHCEGKSEPQFDISSSKRRRKNHAGERVEVCKVEEQKLDQICEQCRSGLHGEVMLLCDRCNKGWHIYCLSPPLKRVPPGNWYCLECLNSEKDSFGFVPGKQFSLEAFRRMADRAKRKWFGSAAVSRAQMEKKFWEIVEGSVGVVDVMYGSDLDTSVYGSGFPRVNDQRSPSVGLEVWDEYCSSPWNLNNLPKLQGSMLRAVHHSIAGVMVPWLYIGMLFSSFCWHFEDHCFYSMNYLHCFGCLMESDQKGDKPRMEIEGEELQSHPIDEFIMELIENKNENSSLSLDIIILRSKYRQIQGNNSVNHKIRRHEDEFPTHPRMEANIGDLNKAMLLGRGSLRGEPKCWYSVPGSEACAFEKVMRNSLPDLFDAQPDLLFQLVTMLNPSVLQENNVPVYSVLQEPGNFVITFPRSYHGGFNFGLNCAEAVNFAPADWLPHGGFGAELYQLYRKAAVLSHEELLCVVAKSDFDSKASPHLKKELLRIYDKEKTWRERLWRNGITKSSLMSPRKQPKFVGVEEDPTCIICQQFLYLSAVICRCRPSAFVCLEHWEHLCECKPNKHRLLYRHTLAELNDLVLTIEKHNPGETANRNLRRQLLSSSELGALSKKVKGVRATLGQLAEEWLWRSCKILEMPYSTDAYVRALKEAEQFLWAGSEMDPVRDMVKNLIEAQNWAEGVRKCISEKSPATIEVDVLYKLKSEISGLQVQLPEVEMLLDLIRQVESCRSRCKEMLESSISPKKLEVLLQELDGFTVNIPELKLLRQYQSDAVYWVSRFTDVVKNVHKREDQENVVDELTCIKKDGELLKIQVDELPRVEVELKKACCRVKALKALHRKMSLDFIQQVVMEATFLHIEKEKLFSDISGVLAVSMCWEERAKYILACEAQMSEFEDVIRTSEDVFVILPSLDNVQEAVSMARSWLNKCKPYLVSDSSVSPASSSLLSVEALKELVSQSKLLKISLEERSMLQAVLKNCIQWEHDACSLLHGAECVLNTTDIGDGSSNGLILKIERKVATMESIIKAGLSLRFDFVVIPKLQDACSTLRWCFKALSFCAVYPVLEDVEMLLEVGSHLRVTYASCSLWRSLIDGMNWLKKALEIPVPCNRRRFKLSETEKVLRQSETINVSFPVTVDRLVNAINKHNLWLEQVQLFFSLKTGDRSWSSLLYLKEHGSTDAFNCSELDMVLIEERKVEQWKRRCLDILGASIGEVNSLPNALLEIKNTLDRSLDVYDKSVGCKTRSLCIYCSSDIKDRDFLTCSMCKDCYHLQCIGPTISDINDARDICPCCHFVQSGKIFQNGSSSLKNGGQHSELNKFIELLSDAEDLCVWIEERSLLHQIVEKALAYKTCLTEIVDFALAYLDKDISIVTRKLSIALKAVKVVGVYDHDCNCKFEQALARNSWRVRVRKLLEGPKRTAIQQIQRHLKEGLAISIPPEDHFRQKLAEMKHIGMQWADKAKKVSVDSGALELDKVFELITEGENLPVHFEKELKLLRDRSMLYCICRKPYDQRPMIACDKCDEWYHFDCIKLSSLPKIYICPACKLETREDLPALPSTTRERSTGKCEEPQTPSPRGTELRRKCEKKKSRTKRKIVESTDERNVSWGSTGIGCLFWRNQKPFRRAARKRTELEILSPFFYVQQ